MGWTIDIKAMTIAVPQGKNCVVAANARAVAAGSNSIVGQRSTVVGWECLFFARSARASNVQRWISYLGVLPLQAEEIGRKEISGEGRRRPKWVKLGSGSHDDLASWRLLLPLATGVDGVSRLESPSHCCFLQSPSRLS